MNLDEIKIEDLKVGDYLLIEERLREVVSIENVGVLYKIGYKKVCNETWSVITIYVVYQKGAVFKGFKRS